jgi:hypothetical protein
MISTKYFYIPELVQMPVLTAHYVESLYKTCLYADFLNLYGGGQENSIFTTGITVAQRYFKRSYMDPNMPEHLLRPYNIVVLQQ